MADHLAGSRFGKVIPPLSDARERLGFALRQLGHDVVGHSADDTLLDDLADALIAGSERLRAAAPRSRDVTGFHEHWNSDLAEGAPVPSYEDRPFTGVSSPWSIEPDVRREGNGVRATMTFRAAHEGAPARCHGGIVAGMFDDMLGSVLGVIGVGAFTGELSVRYEAPVPLHRELVCRCWLDRADGRKLFLSGELSDGDQVLCRTTAIFIQPRAAATQSTFDPN